MTDLMAALTQNASVASPTQMGMSTDGVYRYDNNTGFVARSGERRVIEYVLSPIPRYRHESARER
jgi:hypothetical protein